MSMTLHRLSGCAPAPLALYLKALGILRIVSEQADPDARGWWQDEQFCLLTKLTREELEKFFLETYSPTPFLSPWNKGCGFFKENDPGLVPLEKSTAPRFHAFRQGIAASRELLDAVSKADAAIRAIKARTKTNKSFQTAEQRTTLRESLAWRTTVSALKDTLKNEGLPEAEKTRLNNALATVELLVSDADKPPTKAEADRLKKDEGYKQISRVADKAFKVRKASLIPDCRREWRGQHAEWMAAGVVLDENGDPKYPSLLGTGGNDGNMDFTNNAMQRLGELFDLASPDGAPFPVTASLIRNCLWSETSSSLSTNAIGQFLPASGGGANSSTGADGAPLINAWDFVLMMEGSILFSARATRRLDPAAGTKASAPFVVHAHAAGHASPGNEKDTRGEQWMPIWNSPATYKDVQALLGDARMQLGRQTANRPVDAARAVSRLGVARGIDSFVRYGFLERNGQSTLAVPLGRIRAKENPRSHLIDDLAPWMHKLQRLARDSHAPARLLHAERRLADAVFAALTHDHSFERWQAILDAAVDIEAIQAGGTAISAQPIPKLKPVWVEAIHDGSPEVRLALSLAGAAAGFTNRYHAIDSIRRHWLPLESPWGNRFQVSDKRLVNDPRVVASGRDPVGDCAAIVERRLIDAQQSSQRRLPLKSAIGCQARLTDLAELIDGHVDLARVVKLGRALMALDWSAWRRSYREVLPPSTQENLFENHPDEAWLALRLACLPWPIAEGLNIPVESGIVRRLIAGDGASAARMAAQRLGVSGLRVPYSGAIADSETARLWAAALVFPISQSSARRAVNILVPGYFGAKHA
ncbi:MAG: type I-U CRISPR-associated protein Csx17 [Planctomycetaceae bacterium]